jgi:hypothetical protein
MMLTMMLPFALVPAAPSAYLRLARCEPCFLSVNTTLGRYLNRKVPFWMTKAEESRLQTSH